MIHACHISFNMRKAKEQLFVSYIIPLAEKEQGEQELPDSIIFWHTVPAQLGINKSDHSPIYCYLINTSSVIWQVQF